MSEEKVFTIELKESQIKRLVEYLGHSNGQDVYNKLDWLGKDEQRKASDTIGSVYTKLADTYYDKDT